MAQSQPRCSAPRPPQASCPGWEHACADDPRRASPASQAHSRVHCLPPASSSATSVALRRAFSLHPCPACLAQGCRRPLQPQSRVTLTLRSLETSSPQGPPSALPPRRLPSHPLPSVFKAQPLADTTSSPQHCFSPGPCPAFQHANPTPTPPP